MSKNDRLNIVGHLNGHTPINLSNRQKRSDTLITNNNTGENLKDGSGLDPEIDSTVVSDDEKNEEKLKREKELNYGEIQKTGNAWSSDNTQEKSNSTNTTFNRVKTNKLDNENHQQVLATVRVDNNDLKVVSIDKVSTPGIDIKTPLKKNENDNFVIENGSIVVQNQQGGKRKTFKNNRLNKKSRKFRKGKNNKSKKRTNSRKIKK